MKRQKSQSESLSRRLFDVATDHSSQTNVETVRVVFYKGVSFLCNQARMNTINFTNFVLIVSTLHGVFLADRLVSGKKIITVASYNIWNVMFQWETRKQYIAEMVSINDLKNSLQFFCDTWHGKLFFIILGYLKVLLGSRMDCSHFQVVHTLLPLFAT